MPGSPPYPIFLHLHRRPVLIVGGGAVALRKATGLLNTGAKVTVVSPEFAPAFTDLKLIDCIHAPYAATHMAHKPWRLVFAATDRPEVNEQVQKHAEAAGILCCRCDRPEEGDFSSGSTRHLSGNPGLAGAPSNGVVVAVSTSAASPALAARICEQAAGGVNPVLLMLAGLLGEWRAQVKAQISGGPCRRALLQRIAGEEMEAALRADGQGGATEKFHHWLAEAAAAQGEAAAHQPATPAAPPIAEPLAQGPSKTGRAKHAGR